MSDTENKIVFGSSESHQLILKPSSPLSKTPSGDGVLMRVEGQAGEFNGTTIVPITLEMLKHTLQALSEFSENPREEFTLASEAREFWASMTGDGGDQIVAHCTLNDCDNRYTRLRFEVEFSKEQVLENIISIEQIIASITNS